MPAPGGDLTAEEMEGMRPVTIEFLMLSGETFTAQDFVDEEGTDVAIKQLGEQLATEMSQAALHRFPYWEGESFYFDAIRMDQVAAFSISLSELNGDEEE